MIGGIDGDKSSSEVIRYTRVQGKIKILPSMRECRCQHAVAANNRRINVMGGRNLQGREVAYLSSCEYLPFDDSRQINDLLLCYFMRQPNLVHIYPYIDLLSVGLNCQPEQKEISRHSNLGPPIWYPLCWRVK